MMVPQKFAGYKKHLQDSESSKADTHSKLLVSSLTKVAMSRKVVTSIFMEQMTLLYQIDPRRLKQNPNN